MLEVKKIQDKEEIEVLSQYNCQVEGQSTLLEGLFDNCLNDCTAFDKPRYYGSPLY